MLVLGRVTGLFSEKPICHWLVDDSVCLVAHVRIKIKPKRNYDEYRSTTAFKPWAF